MCGANGMSIQVWRPAPKVTFEASAGDCGTFFLTTETAADITRNRRGGHAGIPREPHPEGGTAAQITIKEKDYHGSVLTRTGEAAEVVIISLGGRGCNVLLRIGEV